MFFVHLYDHNKRMAIHNILEDGIVQGTYLHAFLDAWKGVDLVTHPITKCRAAVNHML
jgi:hypothetical protein